MAEILKEFDFDAPRAKPYTKFDRFLDGKIWKVDFEDARAFSQENYNQPDKYKDLNAFRFALYNAAQRRNKRLRVRSVDYGKALIFQATPREATPRADEQGE